MRLSMRVVIVDYGSGNLRSVVKATTAAAHGLAKQPEIVTTCHADMVAQADYVILPGVGAFADCWDGIKAIDGMADALAAVSAQRPFLGICVGMQLMAEYGNEGGVETPGFGWIGGGVVSLIPDPPAVRVPHMGWNSVHISQNIPVFAGLADGAWMYFLHGYHMACSTAGNIAATTDYGGAIVAAVLADTRLGVQFHPEKSGAAGQIVLRNWLNWRP